MSRLRKVDPLGAALAVAAAIVFLLHGFGGWLARDGALYAYAGQRFADGVPPYLGVLNRSGPLAHAIPGLGALGARAVGADDLLGMRVLTMCVCVGGVWLAYLLGRDAFGSRLAGLMTGTTLLTLAGFVQLATSGPRDKILIVAAVLAACWAMVRGWWVVAGAAVALATLTWQPSFFPAAAAVVVAALLRPTGRERLRAVAGFGAGGLGVLAVTTVAFAAVGAVQEFYEGFVGVHAAGYTKQRGFLSSPGYKFQDLAGNHEWGVWLLAAGTLGMLGLTVAQLRGGARRATCVPLAVGALVCLAWSLYAYQRWPDALFLLPFAAAGMGGLAHVAVAALPRRWARPIGAVVIVSLVVASGITSWLGRSTAVEAQRALPREMLAAAGEGATVQGVGTAEPLVFTGSRNPVRFINFSKGLAPYLDDTLPGGLDGLAARVVRERPDLVVLASQQRHSVTWLRPVFRRHYVLLGGDDVRGYWFAERSLGDGRLEMMRAVLRDAGVPVEPAP